MEQDFETELAEATSAMTASRAAFADVVAGLADDDLARGRRGHWTVAQVLEHVLQSDEHYHRTILQLRDASPPESDAFATTPSTASEWAAALRAACDAIVRATEGVDEATFYRLGGHPRQQYSILSVLENVTLHDHEHSAQIAEVVR